MQVRLALVQLDAVSRELDRWLEEVAPGERAEGAVRVLQPERGAGDRAGGSADVEDLGRAAAEVHVHAVHVREVAVVEAEPGDGDEEVVDPSGAVTGAVDEHEPARAGAGERALGDPGDERRSDGRVHGVSAGGEHVGACLCGQRVTGCDCPSHASRLARSSETHRAQIVTVPSQLRAPLGSDPCGETVTRATHASRREMSWIESPRRRWRGLSGERPHLCPTYVG